MTRSVELKLYAYRKNKDGLIVSFVVHPNDEDFLNGVHIGQVYKAQLEPDFEEEMDEHFLKQQEKTEGEKLRTQSVMLCKNPTFQKWATSHEGVHFLEPTEENARAVLLDMCGIDSRSELALSIPGQESFKHMLDRYLMETGQAAERRS